MTSRRGECDALTAAVLAGASVDDDSSLRHHLSLCRACREFLQDDARLRVLTQPPEAPTPGSPPPLLAAEHILSDAEAALKQHRRVVRRTGVGIAVVLVLAAIAAVWRARDDSPTLPEDPVERAIALHKVFYPEPGRTDYDRLREDPRERARFERALDDPAPLVRRVALTGLLVSGIFVEPEVIERALTQLQTSPDKPVFIAAAEGGAAHLADALHASRARAARAALDSAFNQLWRGGKGPAPATVEPYLHDPEDGIREAALRVLERTPDYEPSARVAALMRDDPVARVRSAAARCLLVRSNERGAALVLEHLRAVPDPDLELAVAGSLPRYEAGAAYARERVAASETPQVIALRYALGLLNYDVLEFPTDLVARVMAAPESGAMSAFADLAMKAGWNQYRALLQSVWEQGPEDGDRLTLGVTLVAWDLEEGDRDRLRRALDICAVGPAERYLRHLEQLSRCGVAQIEAEAGRLLRGAQDGSR